MPCVSRLVCVLTLLWSHTGQNRSSTCASHVIQKPPKKYTSEPEMSRKHTSHCFLPESLGTSEGLWDCPPMRTWLNQLSLSLKAQATLVDISVATKCHFIDLQVHSWLVIHRTCSEMPLFKRQTTRPLKMWISGVVTALHFLTLALGVILPSSLEPSLVVQRLGSQHLPYINLRCSVFGIRTP